MMTWKTRRAAFLFLVFAAFVSSGQTVPCAVDREHCSTVGCAQEKTPGAEFIRAARGLPDRTTANGVRWLNEWEKTRIDVTVADMEQLQIDVNEAFHRPQALAIRDRSMYRGNRFRIANRERRLVHLVGESMAVRLAGYVVGIPRAVRRDSETCNLLGRENNLYRINIAESATDSEFVSILTVMTPLARPREWDIELVHEIQEQRLMVRITGQLLYDNAHRVNSDPDNDLAGEPRRLSLWEIHPITSFEVCTSPRLVECIDATSWLPLASPRLPKLLMSNHTK